MLKWAFFIVGVLAALIVIPFAAGMFLPREHLAASSARIEQPVDSVWSVVRDLGGYAGWWPNLRSVERDADTTGGEVWVQRDQRDQRLPIEVVASEAPRLLVTRIADQRLPFGGTWTYELTQVNGVCIVTITEDGEIFNPLFRVVARLFVGYHGTIDSYLEALGERFGQRITPEHTLMAVLGVSTITPVLPQVASIFDRTPQSVALLISVFTLPGAVFTPVLGVLGDRVGRKKVLVPSLIVFAVAGAGCGLARDFEVLVGLRFLQGTGAAALGALNVTLLGDLYGGRRRAAAMGYNASVLSVGTGIYPAIGGGLAVFGWFFPFFLPIIALPVALAVLWALDNPEPRVSGSLRQYLGVTLRAVWNRQVLTLFATSVVTFILIYGSFLAYFPFLLESSFGATPVFIGLVMSVTSVATAVTSFWLGALAQRFGSTTLVKVGFLLYVVSVAWLPFAATVWHLAAPILLFGVANGINIPSVLTMLNGYAPSSHRGAFMSLNGMLLRLGQTLGPVVIGGAVALIGMKGSFLVGAGLAGMMLLVLLVALRTEPPLDGL
jgi:MFS family permease